MSYALYCHVHPGYVFYVYPMCSILYFVLSIRVVFHHPICHIFYIVMPIADLLGFFHKSYVLFWLVHSDCVPSSDVSYALYRHVHKWCVILSYASYVSLCLVHSYIHLWFVFLSYVSYVLFCLVHSDSFLHPMFYILYSVMYNQDMFFLPCNMCSVCSVHPLIWGVLSTRRTKCTITNCLKSPVVIRYASSRTL